MVVLGALGGFAVSSPAGQERAHTHESLVVHRQPTSACHSDLFELSYLLGQTSGGVWTLPLSQLHLLNSFAGF